MAYDEDAVNEALNRIQPLINALEERIAILEAGSGSVDVGDLNLRISALETMIDVPINPQTVVQNYADGSSITYEKK